MRGIPPVLSSTVFERVSLRQRSPGPDQHRTSVAASLVAHSDNEPSELTTVAETTGRLTDLVRVQTAAEIDERSRFELGSAGLAFHYAHRGPGLARKIRQRRRRAAVPPRPGTRARGRVAHCRTGQSNGAHPGSAQARTVAARRARRPRHCQNPSRRIEPGGMRSTATVMTVILLKDRGSGRGVASIRELVCDAGHRTVILAAGLSQAHHHMLHGSAYPMRIVNDRPQMLIPVWAECAA